MKNQRGFSLVELVVSVTVIATLTILTMTFLTDKFVENLKDNARADLELQLQLTLNLMSFDLKHSASVDTINRWADTHAPGSPSNNFSWQSDADTLVLARPAQKSNSDILYEDPHTYLSYKDNLIYFLDNNGVLWRRTIAANVANNGKQTTCPTGTAGCPTDSRLAHTISALSFTYYDENDAVVSAANARSVKATIRVHRVVFGDTIDIEQSLRSVFRNE